MGNIHVSRSLDQDQRIFRYLSFYDLIELLTFSQISFTGAEPMQQRAPVHARLAHQSWMLLDQEEAIDWHAPDMSQPRLCIVSSIRDLSASLFTSENTSVFIEQTCRVVHDSIQSKLWQAKAVPMLQDNTVSVIVSSADDSPDAGRRRGTMRLLVDLRTLLMGVIVSPDASIRFLELTAKLVQQTTCAFVSRATRPMEQDSAGDFNGQAVQRPAYYPYATEDAAQFAT